MKNVIYGLWCSCHLEDGVRYVGLTRGTAATRLQWHVYAALAGKKLPVYNWMRKHGVENIHARVLENVPADGDIDLAEIRWIATYRAKGANLMNVTDGGEGTHGYVRPQWLRDHSAEMQKGKRDGADNPYFGHTHTAEARARWSKARSGSGNVKAKLTEADIPVIRARFPTESARDIAADYGVNHATIRSIARRHTWASVA